MRTQAKAGKLIHWLGIILTVALAQSTIFGDASTPSWGLSVSVDRVVYEPGSQGVGAVRLEGDAQSDAPMTLKPTLRYGLDKSMALPAVELESPGARSVSVPFTVPDGAWGCTLSVELVNGTETLASADDVFAVGTNPFRLGQTGSWNGDLPESASKLFEGEDSFWSEQWREMKGTWIEIYCGQPTEVVGLATKWDQWITMQDRYRRSRKTIRAFTESAHRLGMKVMMYNNATPSGWVGAEWARQHPEWLAYNYSGGMLGHAAKLYVEDIEKMKTWHETMDPGERPAERWRGFQPFLLAFGAKPELLNYACDQMLDASADFGYDGVRFDGHWTIGQFWTTLGYDIDGRRLNHGQSLDQANRKIITDMKSYIAARKPDFYYGYNYGLNYEYGAAKEPETFAQACADGGMVLFEGAMYDGVHSDWRIGAKAMRDAALRTHQNGGILYGQARMLHAGDMFPLNDFSIRHCLITNFAATSHIYDGVNSQHPSFRPVLGEYYRFALRYGEVLYDPKLRPIQSPEQHLTVTVDEQEHPDLWWKLYTYKRPLDGKYQIITHLVNMPAPGVTKETSTPDKQPPPIPDVLVTFARQPESVYVLDPEQDPWMQEQTPPATSLTISELKNWKIVIQEFSGSGENIREEIFPRPSFEGKDIVPDPKEGKVVFPISSFARGEEGTRLVRDDEAMLGMALHCQPTEAKEPVFFLDGPRQEAGAIMAPGRAKVTFRLKVSDNKSPTPIMDISGPFETKVISCNAFRRAGEYQDFVIEYDVKEGESGYLTTRYHGGAEMWVDSLVFEQLKVATDHDYFSAAELAVASASSRAAHTGKAHVVRGLWHDYLRLDRALERAGMKTSSSWAIISSHQSRVPSGYPATVAELLDFDLIALLNIAADELQPANRKNLREYVHRGGTLFVGGGTRAFGHGGYQNTLLAELLPVEGHPRDLRRVDGDAQRIRLGAEDHPLTEGIFPPAGSKPREDPFSFATAAPVDVPPSPRNIYHHAVNAKPQATVLLQAGDAPILTVWKVGKGTVYAMTGTPLGPSLETGEAWWDWEGWNTILERVLAEASPPSALAE